MPNHQESTIQEETPINQQESTTIFKNYLHHLHPFKFPQPQIHSRNTTHWIFLLEIEATQTLMMKEQCLKNLSACHHIGIILLELQWRRKYQQLTWGTTDIFISSKMSLVKRIKKCWQLNLYLMVEYIAAKWLSSSSFFNLEDKPYLKRRGLIRGKNRSCYDFERESQQCN